jgi:hypothetical protein
MANGIVCQLSTLSAAIFCMGITEVPKPKLFSLWIEFNNMNEEQMPSFFGT